MSALARRSWLAVAALAMLAVIGAIGVSGHWPGTATLSRAVPDGVLPWAGEASEIGISAGERFVTLRREAGAWRVEGAGEAENAGEAGSAVAEHVAAGLRFLAVSAPLRRLGAEEARGLAQFGLDPPQFTLALQTPRGPATIAFGAETPAQTAHYVRVAGREGIVLLPRHAAAEWQAVLDLTARAGAAEEGGGARGGPMLLPVLIAHVAVVELFADGRPSRFERDGTGLWFHHVGQHVHLGPADAHRADPAQAAAIAQELAALEQTVAEPVAVQKEGGGTQGNDALDAETLARDGLETPALILLLYSRDDPRPLAGIEFGATAAGGETYARRRGTGRVVTVPARALAHLRALLRIANGA